MAKKRTLLLFGATGKLGNALVRAMAGEFDVIPKGSRDLDAADLDGVAELTLGVRPDLIVNAAALMGVDPCERDPARALRLNALFPRRLAELAAQMGATVAHISTDAVFDGRKGAPYVETDAPAPLNLYGGAKFLGDAFVAARAERHYIFRLPLMFGPTVRNGQLVERMLARAQAGERLRIADDVVGSPSYSLDLAAAIRRLILEEAPFGLYHLANEGQASLYDLIAFLVETAGWEATVERASYKEFPSKGVKNAYTAMTSIKAPPLRPWRQAAAAYVADCWRAVD